METLGATTLSIMTITGMTFCRMSLVETRQNDIQLFATHQSGIVQNNDIQNDIQQNDIDQNDTQQNDKC